MSEDLELFKSVIKDLKAWLHPDSHKDRDLPGGGKWFYIPWQLIRERLDEVVPNWECSYTSPQYLDKYCVVTCSITILGVTRQAIGNAPIELISGGGKNMERGNAVERAIADAFKNAAEAWGVARYLDDQVDPKTKAAFIKYMQARGDGRAANLNLQNQGLIQPRKTPSPASKPFGQETTKRTVQPAPPEAAIAPPLPSYGNTIEVAPGLADTFNVKLKNAKGVSSLIELRQWLASPKVLESLQDTEVLSELHKRLKLKSGEILKDVDISSVTAEIGIHMKRIGWSAEEGRSHLMQAYGKRSRQELSELELVEFCQFLSQQQAVLEAVK